MKILHKTLLMLAIPFLHSNSLIADISFELKSSNNPQLSCFSYNPYLGVVKDNKNLDIQSDEFEITKDNRLILDGSITIDFDGGILEAGAANIDRDKDVISFDNKGIIRLESLLFGAKTVSLIGTTKAYLWKMEAYFCLTGLFLYLLTSLMVIYLKKLKYPMHLCLHVVSQSMVGLLKLKIFY